MKGNWASLVLVGLANYTWQTCMAIAMIIVIVNFAMIIVIVNFVMPIIVIVIKNTIIFNIIDTVWEIC